MSNSPVDASRRGFFTATLLTREGRQSVKKQITRLGLVPPGLKFIVSAENCLQCNGVCAGNCPQNIIRLHTENHQLAGQPYLNFSNNGCTFCYACNSACPALTESAPNPHKNSIGKAQLDRNTCYAWNDIICMSCQNICPERLFEFDQRRKVSIDDGSCNGCGFCIRVCPARAISIISLATT